MIKRFWMLLAVVAVFLLQLVPFTGVNTGSRGRLTAQQQPQPQPTPPPAPQPQPTPPPSPPPSSFVA
jgi:hypothetical protein